MVVHEDNGVLGGGGNGPVPVFTGNEITQGLLLVGDILKADHGPGQPSLLPKWGCWCTRQKNPCRPCARKNHPRWVDLAITQGLINWALDIRKMGAVLAAMVPDDMAGMADKLLRFIAQHLRGLRVDKGMIALGIKAENPLAHGIEDQLILSADPLKLALHLFAPGNVLLEQVEVWDRATSFLAMVSRRFA